jgi:hypothetical protein
MPPIPVPDPQPVLQRADDAASGDR